VLKIIQEANEKAQERDRVRDEELRMEKERNKRMEERLNEQVRVAEDLKWQMNKFLESIKSQNLIGNSAP
jgi:hypothetical protein